MSTTALRRLAALSTFVVVAAGAITTSLPASTARFQLRVRPLNLEVANWTSTTPPTTAQCLAQSSNTRYCYQPSQIQAAYDLGPLFAKGINGKKETIVIVDAYGSPTIKADLSAFDTAFHIAAPASFKVIHPAGAIPPYSPGGTDRVGWATETSLDVEWAHVMAPKASILLVETPTDEVEGTSGFPDIVKAEEYVVAHKLGTVISQSFAATENTFTEAQITGLRGAFAAASKAGVTVLAGSGDWGSTGYNLAATAFSPTASANWPASDPLVTGVGGTFMKLNASGHRLTPDVAWNDTYLSSPPKPAASGGGLSRFFSRPGYQDGVAGLTSSSRGVPDVAMDGSGRSGVDVYESFAGSGGPGWRVIGGTSLATPLFAGVVALADQKAGHGLGPINPALYGLESAPNSGLVDITSGNNNVSFVNSSHQTVNVPGYQTLPGYDLVSGVGTIDAAAFVPALATAASSPVRVLSASSYQFGPADIVSDGTHVWVANVTSITELNAATGALIRVIPTSTIGDAAAITSDGTHAWVAEWPNAVTEVDESTGAIVRTITDPSYGLTNVAGIASDGSHVWVSDPGSGSNSVTEIDAHTGALIRVISGAPYGFVQPGSIITDGTHVWVAVNGAVTELLASTGAFVRTISGATGFGSVQRMATDGVRQWVSSSTHNSVTELSVSTGSLIRVISGASYDFDQLGSVMTDGIRVWVTSRGGNSVTEFSASTGGLVAVFKGASYGFRNPGAIATSGPKLWVGNLTTVTEFPAS